MWREAIWSKSGRSLYYREQDGKIIEVVVPPAPDFSIAARRVVLTGDYLTAASRPNYDVGPDGFLLLRRSGAETQAVVVHNWGREVREKTRKK